MKNITEEQINEAAEKANGYNRYAKETKGVAFNDGFKAAAKWMQSQPEWISVKDAMPEVNHSVWMYKRDYQYPHTNGHCLGEFDGENWLYMSEPIIEPTHWIPLPPAP